MRYAIISDVHANLEALERVIEDAARNGVERMVSLGDSVGYGPLPAEALRRAREVCAVVLAGNHDDAVSGRVDASEFVNLAAEAVKRHREALSKEEIAYLGSLPYVAELEGAKAVHGDLVDPKKFYYVDDEAGARANFEADDFQLLFVGHTHEPCLYLTGASGAVYRTAAQDFTLEDGKRYIVNPGSVGYPRERNGECFSSYVIYDSVEGTVSYRFLPFSVASVMQRGFVPVVRRHRFAVVGALVAAAAVAIGAAALCTARAPAEQPVAEAPAAPAAPCVVARKEVVLLPGAHELKSDLMLKRGSSSVVFRLTYVYQNGTTEQRDYQTVKGQWFKSYSNLPSDAEKAIFTLEKVEPGDEPVIKHFDPHLE